MGEKSLSMGVKTPKVSIIIPVFNVEKYIAKCIKSLQVQTLEDLEFIFIDDCGLDNSVAIIEEAAKGDSRIRILYNERNMGAGRSRNRGINAAVGEFIAFVDPDDWVDTDFYEILYRRAEAGNYDIVKANRIKAVYHENGTVRYEESDVNARIIAGLSDNKALYPYFTSEHQAAIFRTTMVKENEICNGSTSHSENSIFLLKAAYYCKKFCLESNTAYYYFQRKDSSVHVYNEKKFQDELVSFSEQLDFMDAVQMIPDSDYCTFMQNKIAFLMRRYDEIRRTPELRYFRRSYVEQLCDEISRIRAKSFLKQRGIKTRMLVKHQVNAFIFINEFTKQTMWIRDKERKIKLSLRRRKRKLKDQLKETAIYTVYKKCHKERAEFKKQFEKQDIIYRQNHRGSILFCERFLEIEPTFAKQYINAFLRGGERYNCNLNKTDALYQEHIKRIENNELCWRYIKRFGHISKTTIYLDETENLCMRGEILGGRDVIETNSFIIHPQPQRRIIEGQVLADYIKSMEGVRAKKAELRQYLDYLFDVFAVHDPNKLDGYAYDAFPYNCIIQEGHKYRLFDLEFEFKDEIDKGYMIYKTVKTLPAKGRKQIYYELCEHYKVVANWEYWERFNFRMWLDTITDAKDTLTDESSPLFSKYFLE